MNSLLLAEYVSQLYSFDIVILTSARFSFTCSHGGLEVWIQISKSNLGGSRNFDA